MITESVASLLGNTSESWGQETQIRVVYLMPRKCALPCKCHCPLQTRSHIQAWQSSSQSPKWSVVLALCQRVGTVLPRLVLHSFFAEVWPSFSQECQHFCLSSTGMCTNTTASSRLTAFSHSQSKTLIWWFGTIFSINNATPAKDNVCRVFSTLQWWLLGDL